MRSHNSGNIHDENWHIWAVERKNIFSKTKIYFHQKTTPQLLGPIGLQNMKVGEKTNFGDLPLFAWCMLTLALKVSANLVILTSWNDQAFLYILSSCNKSACLTILRSWTNLATLCTLFTWTVWIILIVITGWSNSVNLCILPRWTVAADLTISMSWNNSAILCTLFTWTVSSYRDHFNE